MKITDFGSFHQKLYTLHRLVWSISYTYNTYVTKIFIKLSYLSLFITNKKTQKNNNKKQNKQQQQTNKQTKRNKKSSIFAVEMYCF